MKFIAFIVTVLFTVTTYSQTAGGLSFESKVGNFGEIKQNTPAEIEFVFKNTAQETIEIKNVKSNTRAISFKIKDKQVEPGQTSSLTIIHNAKDLGPVRNTISIHVSGQPSIYTLAVRGNVVKP